MLHHVEIYVSNLETSRAFYDFLLTKLGSSLYQEWEDGLSFKKADHYALYLEDPDGIKIELVGGRHEFSNYWSTSFWQDDHWAGG